MKEMGKIGLLTCALVMLSACTTTKDTFEANDLPTMKQIYDAQFGANERDRTQLRRGEKTRSGHDADPHQRVTTKRAEKTPTDSTARHLERDIADTHSPLPEHLRKLKQQFITLPNPLMLMYIPAHLTTAGTPVPGYSTYFPFYERDQVALPSERPSPH